MGGRGAEGQDVCLPMSRDSERKKSREWDERRGERRVRRDEGKEINSGCLSIFTGGGGGRGGGQTRLFLLYKQQMAFFFLLLFARKRRVKDREQDTLMNNKQRESARDGLCVSSFLDCGACLFVFLDSS